MSLEKLKGLSRRTVPSHKYIHSFSSVSPSTERDEQPLRVPLLEDNFKNLNLIPSVSNQKDYIPPIEPEPKYVSLPHLPRSTRPPRENISSSSSTTDMSMSKEKKNSIRQNFIAISPNPGSLEFIRSNDSPNPGLGIQYTGNNNSAKHQNVDQFNSKKDAIASTPAETQSLRSSANPEKEQKDEKEIVKFIECLRTGSIFAQKNAVKAVRHLSKVGDSNRLCIAENGAIPLLCNLLKSEDMDVCEQSITALLNTSITNENKLLMVEQGVIEPLVDALHSSSVTVRENAAATLFSLSIVDMNKESIGSSNAIPPLVSLLKTGTEQGKRDACKALFNLSIISSNKWRIVSADAINCLIDIMKSSDSSMAEKAVSVLANLATIPEGREAMASNEDGIPGLADLLEEGSPRGKENATVTLLLLAKHSNVHKMMIAEESVFLPLNTLVHAGTSRAKEKATALLGILREVNN